MSRSSKLIIYKWYRLTKDAKEPAKMHCNKCEANGEKQSMYANGRNGYIHLYSCKYISDVEIVEIVNEIYKITGGIDELVTNFEYWCYSRKCHIILYSIYIKLYFSLR
jgi:hypothetical protein